MTLVPMTTRTKKSPRTLSGFEDFDRIFDNFFHNALTNSVTNSVTGSAPMAAGQGLSALPVSMDISETESAFLIEAELPGLDEKDIELTIEDGVLTLFGHKETVVEDDDNKRKRHRVERRFGEFKRVLQLPENADDKKVGAELRNGVLHIEIAKRKEPEKDIRNIKVKKIS